MCRAAERAAETFPNTKIIISTLLPRKDFHPDTIQKVNSYTSRGCALIPNVHLAHHTNITPHHLYDHVHLNKNSVKEFARTLKDAALGRHTPTHTADQQRGQLPKLQRQTYSYSTPIRRPPTQPLFKKTQMGHNLKKQSIPQPTQRSHLTRPAPGKLPSLQPGLLTTPPAHRHQPKHSEPATPLHLTRTEQTHLSYAQALIGPQHTDEMGGWC
ncbi:uncharacterized protein LOC134312420 [Trichomycterus rosablanca]|uniref:uncharacterized protein LOC134312420 n=1 Tax=Trichomycterus rosablanca TaxID=2290929 RepID=UPI002F35FEB6